MQRPRFLMVRARDAWLRCDHAHTRLDDDGRVRLAYAEADDVQRVSDGVFGAWLLAKRGAFALPCPPDVCGTAVVRLLEHHGKVRDGTSEGWREVPWAAEPVVTLAPGEFGTASPEAGQPWGRVGGAARDPAGRVWVVDRTTRRLVVFDSRFRRLDVPILPSRFDPVDVAVTRDFVVVAGLRDGAPSAWRASYGGEWTELVVSWPAGALPISAGGGPTAAVVVLRGAAAAAALVVEADRARIVAVPTLEDPLHVVGTDDGFLISEIADAPGKRTAFTAFRLDDEGLHAGEQLLARGFDGRAALLLDGEVVFTTSHGVVRLVATRPPLATAGRVETFALDSERYACPWHRVFVDVCVPEGCAVTVSARASDEPWPSILRARPRRPAEEPPPDVPIDWVIGSRAPEDDEGWVEVGALDRRPRYADLPFPPDACPAPGFQTLEGLLKSGRGRYLWLRVSLVGSGRATPVVDAVRVTLPRPSLLDQLPKWWGSDPATAEPLERWLALFEGVLTETDQRIEALPWLFDARICPPDALEWLAGFVALAFDRRITEGVRRRLLGDIGFLWRWRGTVAGLERLTAILSGAETRVIEAFRTRRHSGSVLGQASDDAAGVPGSVLGPGMQLGGGATPSEDDWEARVDAAYLAWASRRAAAVARGEPVCPETAPPNPIDPDPLRSFVRRTAHRFSVVVLAPRDATTDAVLHHAVESYKPAHTVHEICWLDDGFRLGVNTLVGVGTRLGDVAATAPAIVGQSALGGATTLSHRTPEPV